MSASDRLPAASLAFLRDLAAHNDRRWYEANRDRCEEDLWVPCRALVREILAGLAKPFPRVTGSDRGVGGSLTRLHRDGEDLKRKDFTAFARRKATEATKPGFAGRVVGQWEASEPLMGFLCGTLGLEW